MSEVAMLDVPARTNTPPPAALTVRLVSGVVAEAAFSSIVESITLTEPATRVAIPPPVAELPLATVPPISSAELPLTSVDSTLTSPDRIESPPPDAWRSAIAVLSLISLPYTMLRPTMSAIPAPKDVTLVAASPGRIWLWSTVTLVTVVGPSTVKPPPSPSLGLDGLVLEGSVIVLPEIDPPCMDSVP
jgi:hypothetical protein